MFKPLGRFHRLNRVKTARLGTALLVVLVSGCATTGQRIALDCADVPTKPTDVNQAQVRSSQLSAEATKPARNVASNFEDAATCTHTLVTAVQQRLESHENAVDIARFGTVIGTLGATTAAVYQAHRDLIVGLGLLGGSSFVYGSLYAPSPNLATFSAGLDAAICLDTIARQAAGSAASLRDSVSALHDSVEQLRRAQETNLAASATAKAGTSAALTSGDNVRLYAVSRGN